MRPAAWLGVLIVVLAVAPLVLPAFFLQLLTEIAIVGLFVMLRKKSATRV